MNEGQQIQSSFTNKGLKRDLQAKAVKPSTCTQAATSESESATCTQASTSESATATAVAFSKINLKHTLLDLGLALIDCLTLAY